MTSAFRDRWDLVSGDNVNETSPQPTGKSCAGLRDKPFFFLPMCQSPTGWCRRRLTSTEGTVMSDFDIGECFLNFVLHETMQSLCGVDLTKFFGNGKLLWEIWTRAAMGLRSSPYQAVQAVMVAKEFVMGNRGDPANAFRWDVVRLNLPGSKNYDPAMPLSFYTPPSVRKSYRQLSLGSWVSKRERETMFWADWKESSVTSNRHDSLKGLKKS